MAKAMTVRDSIAEAEHIKAQLKLRWNTEHGCYEVWTTIHGSGGVFKWYKVSEATAQAYKNLFGITAGPAYAVDRSSGALVAYKDNFGNHKQEPNHAFR